MPIVYSPLVVVFLGSVVIQLFYLLFFFARLAFFKDKPSQKTISPKPVSVVVCVRNEYESIQKLLPLLLDQQYPEFEIVIVSDRSPDDCYDWLLLEERKHLKMKLVRVHALYDHITPKKFALTLGILAAQFDQILLTDSDCEPTSDLWISSMQSSFSEKKHIILGVSQYEYYKGFLNFVIRNETFYTAIQYLSFALAGLPYMGVGRNLAYKKSLFTGNNGFHSHQKVVGGDDDLFIREVSDNKNTTISVSIESQTVSIPKKTWKEWYRQKKRHLSVGKYYKLSHKILLGGLPLSQSLFWFCTIFLLVFQDFNILFLTGFFVRILVYLIVLQACIRKIHANVKWYGLILFDIFYVFYYMITGISAVFAKKISWH